jgi:oxygen-independent coproporphyrinogen-3 oxidase
MKAATVDSVLQDIARHWALADDCEITLEANPNSVEAQKFAEFAKSGVNRLSLGVQSLRDEALAFLGRAHDAREARHAIELAAKNFPRFSFDLIYARRDQTLGAWETELREALALAGEHLSLYQLTIEPGTQFHTLNGRGEKLTADNDNAAAMFELTQEILNAAGLPAYEISNHAKPGAESRHNLAYWRYDDFIGISPGAHGRYVLNGARFATENHRAPNVWLGQVKEQGHGLRVHDPVDRATAQREALMMGLRLAEGIDRNAWRDKFGAPITGEPGGFISSEKIARLENEGFLARDSQNFKTTAAGFQRLNAVLEYLAA